MQSTADPAPTAFEALLFGRVWAVFFLLIGVLFTAIAGVMLADTGATLKLFVIGPGLIGGALPMLFASGQSISVGEMRATPAPEKAAKMRSVFVDAPRAHQALWLGGALVGTVVGLAALGL